MAVVNFTNRVSVLDPAGGQTRALQSGWEYIELAAWTADGQGVIVADRRSEGSTPARVEPPRRRVGERPWVLRGAERG